MPYPRNALLLAGSRMARSEMSCAESASVRSRRTVGVGLKANRSNISAVVVARQYTQRSRTALRHSTLRKVEMTMLKPRVLQRRPPLDSPASAFSTAKAADVCAHSLIRTSA
jgi:hypothetical protein